MAATFHIRVLTPEKTVREAEIVSLQAPGSEGFLGVWAHHAPLITALQPGPLTLRDASGREDVLAISGGFLEVSGNRATVLADAVERPEAIDLDRARAARDRARQRLSARRPGLDVDRAQAALLRALNRIRVAGRYGHGG
jgi:F-type H+-transporting ATPase subunit epsilon